MLCFSEYRVHITTDSVSDIDHTNKSLTVDAEKPTHGLNSVRIQFSLIYVVNSSVITSFFTDLYRGFYPLLTH